MRTHYGRLVFSALSIAYLASSAGGCGEELVPVTTVVQCTITRLECAAESLGPDGPQCALSLLSSPTPLQAIVCATDDTQDAADAACATYCQKTSNPGADYNYPAGCQSKALILTNTTTPSLTSLPVFGTCRVPGAGTTKASVSYNIHQHLCSLGDAGQCTSITDSSKSSSPAPADCVDLSSTWAVKLIKPSVASPPSAFQTRDGVVDLINVSPGDPACNVQAAALTAYDLTPGPLGEATAAGMTVPFSLTGGSATFNGNQLWDLRVNIANLTVAGTQVSNVQLTNTFPAPLNIGDVDNPSHTGIAPNNLTLNAVGFVGGVKQIFTLQVRPV
jgi:hypothetical protein